ncbi:SIMPL domain-containing protein [Gallaecimonas kandeliae]|uniref:SIMPL domain-containing protein n=1 Tax=Gallaecimonas kandeliae TaxID=3029055 RepID=UPI0026477B73|nr:SIMPL domain-containing protein [Gallaecimonas kandeliae]WKE67374.1 SIMPL domain-containing protein [Gallaecimonas kandeliae]
MKIKAITLMLALVSPLGLAMDRYIAVQGEASRAVTPDEVTFSVTFIADGQDPDQLLSAIEARAKPLLARLKSLGLVDKDIQGYRFEVFPRYEKDKPVGLRVQQRYQLTVHGFDKYPAVLKATTQAKVDQLGQASLGYSGQEQLYQELLAEAVTKARAKAKLLAKAGDAQLGKLVSVDEQGSYRPPVMFLKAAAMSDARESAQTPGEIQVQANVSARFALKD